MGKKQHRLNCDSINGQRLNSPNGIQRKPKEGNVGLVRTLRAVCCGTAVGHFGRNQNEHCIAQILQRKRRRIGSKTRARIYTDFTLSGVISNRRVHSTGTCSWPICCYFQRNQQPGRTPMQSGNGLNWRRDPPIISPSFVRLPEEVKNAARLIFLK